MIDIIYSLIYIVPLSLFSAFTLVPGIMQVNQPSNPLLSLIVIIPTVVFLCLMKNVDNKKRIILSGCTAALIIGMLLVTKRETKEKLFEDNPWIGCAFILAVAVVAFAEVLIRFRKVKLITAGILLIALISSYWVKFINYPISYAGVFLILFTILLEEVRYRVRGRLQIKRYVITIIPFLLLETIALCIAPYKKEPYDWAGVKKVFNAVSDGILTVVQNFDYHDSANDLDSSIGFSEQSGTASNLDADEREMMELTIFQKNFDSIYLDGKYFEDFDGRNWNEAKESYPYMMDSLETSCLTSMIKGPSYKNYFHSESIEIEYSGQNTRYMFAPLKTLISGNPVSKDGKVIYDTNELLFNRKMGNKTHYRIEYICINQNENSIPELSILGKTIDKEVWDNETLRNGLKSNKKYTYEKYLDYLEQIHDNSLWPSSPSKEQLSEEVLNFLDNAVAGSQTDYEKLIALTKAFSDFEYTTSPGMLPDDIESASDYLDYFVIDTKRGYCNHFATAFVLLCRAEGIPARYVHGYHVPIKQQGKIQVLNTMAHAYPEAYVEGIGWMVFDPTPGYSAVVSWDGNGKYEATSQMTNPYAEPIGKTDEVTDEAEDESIEIDWMMITVPIALCLFVLVIIFFIQKFVNLRKFDKMSENEKALMIGRRIMNILRHRGFIKAECETVNEFALRALSEQNIKLEYFARTLEKVLYSQKILSTEEIAGLNEEYLIVKDSLKGPDKVLYGFLIYMGLC